MTYEEYCNWFANVGPNCVPPDESIFREYISPVLERVEDECDRLRAHVEKLRKQVETADAKVAELEDALSDANAVLEKFAEKEPENEKAVVPSPTQGDTYRQLAETLRKQVETADAKVAQLEDDLSYANAVIEKFAEKEPEDEKPVIPSPTQGDTYRQLSETLDQLTETAFCVARELAHIREGK